MTIVAAIGLTAALCLGAFAVVIGMRRWIHWNSGRKLNDDFWRKDWKLVRIQMLIAGSAGLLLLVIWLVG